MAAAGKWAWKRLQLYTEKLDIQFNLSVLHAAKDSWMNSEVLYSEHNDLEARMKVQKYTEYKCNERQT